MILTVIPFWKDNAAQTEQLLEFVFAQNDRAIIPAHVLLVCPPTVDKEMLERIKISAELAFRGVHLLEVRPLSDDRAPKWKNANNVFTQAALHISKAFRWPFLWLEPDCVPLRRGWHSRLVLEYGTQPKHFFGARLKIEVSGKPEMFIMARNGIYPVDAILDIPSAEAPFEISSAVKVFPKFMPTKLLQQLTIATTEDLAKVRADAIILHGDKQGILRRQLEASFIPQPTNPVAIPIAPGEPPAPPEAIPINGTAKKRGRPSRLEMAARLERMNGSLTQ